jgi:MipA family protein
VLRRRNEFGARFRSARATNAVGNGLAGMKNLVSAACACLLAAFSPQSAAAQERRSIDARVALGAEVRPDYPGADELGFGPLVNVDVRRGDDPFEFEAPDESFGFSIVSAGGFKFGPALNIEGSRKPSEVGAAVDKVSTTFEAGGFVQYELSPSFRLRTELRQGIGGHDGLVGNAGADFIARDGDKYVFSLGPRLLFSDGRYQRAYFGVTPAAAAAAGLPDFRPGGGIHGVGATAGLLFQLGGPWGVYSYARYDRLIDDAADSPITRRFGSANQFSGGLALSYTFNVRR